MQQHVHGALQQADRVEVLERDQRLHHVQLQLAAFGCDGQCQAVTDDLERNLVNGFRDDRVDLAGHDCWQWLAQAGHEPDLQPCVTGWHRTMAEAEGQADRVLDKLYS